MRIGGPLFYGSYLSVSPRWFISQHYVGLALVVGVKAVCFTWIAGCDPPPNQCMGYWGRMYAEFIAKSDVEIYAGRNGSDGPHVPL